jgi:formate dehydrogenase subunit delta
MAHEIARQFASEPPEESAQTIAAHLRKFWAPTMIAALVSEADAGADLEPLVARVVELLR